ncbi:hypothetical protein QJQ45_013693 [Haematococcus lacustris]|nr:hypothetical protein QJQ45_013693 [Haematococcus lacustris]
MYSTSPEATAVRIQLWLEEKNIEGASTVTHCPMRHFNLGQTGYTCHPYQYNVKLPPASISRFLEAYETDPPLTDIATEKGVVQGRMQCTLLEEHPRNSSHTMRVQAHLQLLPGADCLGIWPPEHMQGAHTPQAIRQVMHILGCVLALSDLGAPPGSQEAWRAYAARVPLSSLRLMQALSVNAVTQERGQQAGAYTAHSTTPALREMLTACHSLVFELEGILTLRLSAANPPPLPPHCIAIGKPTGGPVSPSELCDVLWALHDAHHPPDAVAPLVIANEHPLGTVARAITACCMPNGLPLSSHGVREAPILYLTPASKQAMVSALAAAQDLGGVVETQRGQVWIGVPRSLAGVSGGINLPIWLKEVGTPVDAADPATRARTASRNTRYTGLQHVPDQAALTFRAIAAVTDGITMQQVVGANAAHELQGRATTYLVEARVMDHSDAKYTPAVLRALTHEGNTQPTPQPAATNRGWGTRAVAVATQLQAAPPRNTTATTAPIPPTGGSAARAPGRGGAGGRGRGPNSVPDPSGRGTSRGPSPNLVRGASPGAWAGIGTSSRASSIAAFDELAIEAGFLYTAQAMDLLKNVLQTLNAMTSAQPPATTAPPTSVVPGVGPLSYAGALTAAPILPETGTSAAAAQADEIQRLRQQLVGANANLQASQNEAVRVRAELAEMERLQSLQNAVAEIFCEDLEVHCAYLRIDPADALPNFLSGKAREEMAGDDLRNESDVHRRKLLDPGALRMSAGSTLNSYITEFRNTLTVAVPSNQVAMPEGRAADDGVLHFSFPGRVNGFACTMLFDSGAAASFINCAAVEQYQLASYKLKQPKEFLVANGQPVVCTHACSVQLNVQTLSCRVELLVMPEMFSAFDVLMGSDWLQSNGVLLDYLARTITVQLAAVKTVLKCEPAAPIMAPHCAHILAKHRQATVSAKVAYRWLRKGGQSLVALISSQPINPKSRKRLLEGEEAGVVQPAQPAIQQPQQEPQPQLVLEQPLPPPPLPVHPLHAVNMTEQLLAAYAADEAFASTVDQYDLDKHGLYRTKGKNQIVVPHCPDLKARILVEMHDAQFAGHVGITKTLERDSRIFWWPRMRSEVRHYLVLLSTKNLRLKPGKAKKLLPRFIGPFKVLEHVGPVAVRLDLPPAMARMHPVFHVALLRPYTTNLDLVASSNLDRQLLELAGPGSPAGLERTKYGLTITRVAHLRNTDDWNDDNLDTIAIEYATLNFLCKTNGHSMALRKLGGQWKLLDSDSPSKSAIAICELSRSYTTRFNEVFVIAPDPAATPAQTMAATRQGISHIISHKEDNQNPSQCYMERQYKQCCLVHAINMAIGKPMIWPEDVITHCKSLDTHIQGLANQARQEHMIIPLRSSLPHIYEESGNFTISTINHYLYHHHKDLHLYPITTTTTTTNITPELLTTLTGKTDSYTNTAAILITHNHATTIRHINNAWHWLDSEQGRPCRLDTPEDWLQLKGTLVQIKKGDAADTNLIHPLCWLADPTRRATTEQLEQHLRTTHIDLTTQDLGTQPAHNPRTDRPLPTAQPASSKRILTATTDTHPTDKQARPRLRQVAPTVTLPTLQDRASSSKRPTTSGTIVDKRRTEPRAQTKDPHTQTLMYRYLNTAPTPPPAAIPTTPPPPTDNLPEHPGPHPQHNTLPTWQPQPTHNRQHITLTTLNVRSLHRSRNDVLNLVHQHSPDILILTETMTQPKSNNPSSGWLRRVMPDYTTHRHRGHSDVLIGIKHHLAIQMKTTMLPPSIDAEVNARCVILTLNQHQCEQLTIIATYWPSGNNGDALLLRGKMQEHIRTATGHLPGSLILAGDINATMKTEDRSEHTEYTQDSMMRGFAAEMHLKEADPGDRAWTYQQPHCNSRIDAILTRDARHGPEHRTYVDTNVYLSDHRPLTATLNTARLGIDLAAPHKPPKHSHTILTTPITNKDREAYRLAVQQPSSGVPQLHAELTAYLAPIYTEATHHLATLGKTNPQQPQRLTSVAGRPAREAVDTAATMLTNLLQTCRTAAIKTCNTKTLTRGGQHYQRRTMCRIRLALGRKLKTARDLSRKANSLLKQTNVHQTIDELTIGTDAINEEIRDAVQARQGEDPTENHVQAALAQLTNTYRGQIHQLDDDDSALAIAQARVRMQQLISTQPKKANKRILRPSRTDHKGLQALADPDTKTICTAPADLNRIITAAYGQKLAAPTPKTGHYTNTQTRNYPWARAKADDAFALHACQNIHWLHTAIMDKAGFQECISRLSGGKAPGPDGVENEIIKMLPWEMRETIHQLFIIMWATGCTPTAWKTSDTCLLYKDKGQETDLNSYRPVGLANTVYKLWTSLITKTLSEYAEANGMLSKNQAGFRSHRNTTQQLQMLVMALEDAKLAKADIYALLVDFTSAFNTTCQDKLLWIMHDLGFPTDATDAVKDLYTGATTRFKTPYGHTDPVSVNRGTIQGDSLSPFLFLIYIEPLLRWLQVGARGYKFKSATADSGERATVSSIDYADDIAILCNTLRNLRCQADKLSAFSDWGHLIISHSKTLATAALHHSVETGMCSNAAEADKRARQQLRTVSLQGKPVTYHRPTSPFTYLGVLITMTLDWKPQHTAMITQLRQKLERLRRSFASARQAIHIIRTAIIPSLAYSFCAVPCTPGDLELYDKSINQCVKLKLRLPLGTPNAIIREDADKLGIGISSTAQEYHARNTTALTHSLQSTDVAHAHISRSMLHKQITWLNTQASTQGHRMLTLLHHTLRARQLVYASISGLSATEEGLPLYHEECQTLGRLITQASSSQAHDVVSASITCLKSLGITHASELSCKGNTHIITGSMLTSKYGKKVKQKHIIALNKLAAMAAQPSCPDATATRAIRDSRNTSPDLPPDQRKITTWAAGLTELAPTPAVPDTRTRYMDMKAYAAMHATQPTTADRTAEAPAVHDATRTSSRLLKRERRATQSAPTKPTPPKAGTKRKNEGRQTQTIPQDIVRVVGLDLPGLSSWKVDKACRCKPKNLGCILGAMYGHQEAITSIDGWQWDGINKENYYKVHWKPTVIDRWALPLCAEEGYTPTHIETISREEAKDVCTCELCWLPRGDSPTCHNCKRAYHPACLEEAHLSGHKEPGYWLCPICKFGNNDFKTTMRQSAHSDLIPVHWHPTLEPAPLITAHLDYMAKRNDYDEEDRQIQEARHARPDAHLPAHTRQGLPDPHTWLPRCTNLHSKATFHTYPINPQTDIVGTGNCETFLQLHPHMTAPAMSLSTGEPIMPRHDLVQHVTVHDESGRTVGLLTKDQHQHLHAWLQHTPHTRNLATEVVALLRRQDAQSSHHPMRGAQDKALNTLHTTRSFPSTVQRWADPLTVRPETTTYWSPDTNDTAFGAHHNCLLVRHTGLSTWNVPADDAVALKCVNHAIHSATQEEAMATIMLIPGKKGISYPKHIDTLRRYPEYCQHLASIPPTKTRCPKPGKHAKLHIYVIWNATGQQLVTKGNPQGWLASTATALHPQRDTHPIRNRPTNQSQPATPPSGHKQHMRLPLDRDLPTSGHQRSHEQLTHHSTTQPRMAITEWATLAYSDGSCIKTSGAAPASVGAGVYIPENNVLITVALDDPESNTINKAELTTIHAALKAGAKRIATDSLCSLYQIRRALANPMSLITHRHNDILTAIATLIIDSPVTIHFFKVRAHSGIIGNEGADALAKHAALHPELANTPAYSPTTRKETRNWLSNAADGDSPAPLPDCRKSVRAHMHKHKLGLANQDSIYYQMSQEITKVAATGAGERVMIDTNISTHAQRTALLYRTGGLYNQKLAMRWKRATDDRCPLCGEADSATHLLSGCSETLPLVQERHNGAGRLITKAISKGTLGGYISFADTGSWEKGAKESLDLPSDTLHTTLQTLGLKPEDTKHTTRPDILMVLPHKKASKDDKDTRRAFEASDAGADDIVRLRAAGLCDEASECLAFFMIERQPLFCGR